MTHTHRNWHRVIWPALALLVGLALTAALVLRAPPDPPAQERKP